MLSYPPYSPHFPIVLIALAGFLFMLLFLAAMLIPYWFIFKKAGFSPWLAVLMALPLANIVVLYILAFTPWNVASASQTLPPASAGRADG